MFDDNDCCLDDEETLAMFLLEQKKGLSEGFGVEPMLMVSTSGPESLYSSSSWSNRSSISAGSTVPSETTNKAVIPLSAVCRYSAIQWMWSSVRFN